MFFVRAPRPAWVAATVMMAGLLVAPTVARFADLPPAKSPDAVKALAALLDEKKLTAFAAHDGDAYKFVAVLYAPRVQMLAISATYERAGDIDYYIDHKTYETAFADLRSGIYAKDKVLVEDLQCNGLVGQPKKGAPQDTVTIGTERHVFDGLFSDPNKTERGKAPYDVYAKAFADADERYMHILTVITDAVKKAGL
jgi:hypothetical protein